MLCGNVKNKSLIVYIAEEKREMKINNISADVSSIRSHDAKEHHTELSSQTFYEKKQQQQRPTKFCD